MATIVIAFDSSGSTIAVPNYYDRVNAVIQRYVSSEGKLLVISWNHKAKVIAPPYNVEQYKAAGCTEPSCFIPLLPSEEKYKLIVFTDGEISNLELQKCHTSKELYLNNLESVEYFFIGNESCMNTRITSVFYRPDTSCVIHVNEKVPLVTTPHLDLKNVSLQEFLEKDGDIVASLIETVKHAADKDTVKNYRRDILALQKRFFDELACKEHWISDYFNAGKDWRGCVSKVKSISNSDKAKIQQKVNRILHLLDLDSSRLFSLEYLHSAAPLVEPKRPEPQIPEEQEEEEELTCDVMLATCRNVCFLITKPANALLEDSKLAKDCYTNPFKVISIAKDIHSHVEFNKIDYNFTWAKLDEAVSPFTRQDLLGVYVCYQNSLDDAITQNNKYVLARLFYGTNKLPGFHGFWQIAFLYVLKDHPKWSQDPAIAKLIHSEITQLCKRLQYYVTLTSLLEPSIKEPLDVCLWYVTHVAPVAFPNSAKNVLRFMDRPEEFVKMAEYVLNCPVPEIVKRWVRIWRVWAWLLHNRNNLSIPRMILAQKYRHVMLRDGSILLLNEEINNELPYKEELQGLEYEQLMSMYKMSRRQDASLHDAIGDHLKDNSLLVYPISSDVDTSYHVKICTNSCRPITRCSVTGLHWKICAGKYNVRYESFFECFYKYTKKRGCFPSTAEDLLAFHNAKFYFIPGASRFILYPNANVFDYIFKSFEFVMQTWSAQEYVLRHDGDREQLEKECNLGHHAT